MEGTQTLEETAAAEECVRYFDYSNDFTGVYVCQNLSEFTPYMCSACFLLIIL